MREDGILQLQTDFDSVVVLFGYLLPQIFVALTNTNTSLAIYVVRNDVQCNFLHLQLSQKLNYDARKLQLHLFIEHIC